VPERSLIDCLQDAESFVRGEFEKEAGETCWLHSAQISSG